MLNRTLFHKVGSPTKKGLTAARFLPGNNNLVVTGGLAGHVQIINIRFLELHLSFFFIPGKTLLEYCRSSHDSINIFSALVSFLRLERAQLVVLCSASRRLCRTPWSGLAQTGARSSASRWTAWRAGWPRGIGWWWLRGEVLKR